MWDVRPEDALPRTAYDRRNAERAADDAPPEPAALVDPLLEDGWLCFQAGVARRRFAPIPPAWFELPDAVLRVMVDIASPVSVTPPAPNPAVPESR